MIFVTVGTNQTPFDRLLLAIGDPPNGQALVVQHGPSIVRPPAAACFDFLPYGTLVDYVTASSVVVAHAGTGSVLVALQAGKRPIVMPRLERLGEAVDNHQLDFARRMEDAGLVDCIETAAELRELIALSGPSSPPTVSDGLIAKELRDYLVATIGPPGRRGEPYPRVGIGAGS